MSLTMLCDSPFRRMKQCLDKIERKTGAAKRSYFDMKKKVIKLEYGKGDEFSLIKGEEGQLE